MCKSLVTPLLHCFKSCYISTQSVFSSIGSSVQGIAITTKTFPTDILQEIFRLPKRFRKNNCFCAHLEQKLYIWIEFLFSSIKSSYKCTLLIFSQKHLASLIAMPICHYSTFTSNLLQFE